MDDLKAQGKELNELKTNAAANQMRIDELTTIYNENQEINEAYNQKILRSPNLLLLFPFGYRDLIHSIKL